MKQSECQIVLSVDNKQVKGLSVDAELIIKTPIENKDAVLAAIKNHRINLRPVSIREYIEL